MISVEYYTKGLYQHVSVLEEEEKITENQAHRFRDRINALEGDLEEAYE